MIDISNLAIHIPGFIAMFCIIASIQMKTKEKYLYFQIIGAFSFGAYFLLLNGYTGVLTNLLLCIQALIALYFLKKNTDIPKWVMITLFSITVLFGFFIIDRWLDLLPLLVAVTTLIIYFQSKEKMIRYLSLILAIWIPYAIYYNAWFSLITSVFFLVSTLIAIYRYDLRKT